jgi:probable addiction module antidote protein
MPTTDYKERLLEDLKDLEYATGYLTACYEEGPDVFLLGVRDVAEAHGGLRALAEETSLNRENLYDMLSKDGNPRLSSLSAVLDKLGIEVAFKPKLHRTKAA